MENHRRTEQTFASLMEDEHNTRCFECGNPGATWASVTNGVFLCQSCAGLHRGFGVHLSFVRSTKIDSWSDEQLGMMEMGGNKRLKNFLNNYDIPHMPYKAKYETKASHHYREMLANLVEGKPSNPPPPVDEGRQIVEYERNNSTYMQGIGSSSATENKQSGIETKTKEIASSIGGMFKSGWGFMQKTTNSMAEKFNSSGVKESLGKAATATKTGFLTAVDKSKELGGKIADSTVEFGGKVKASAMSGIEKISEATKKDKKGPKPADENTGRSEDDKKSDYFGDTQLSPAPK